MRRTLMIGLVVAALLVVAVVPVSACDDDGYVVTPIGRAGTAHAINRFGAVVGYGGSTGSFSGFLYRDGEITDVMAPQGASTSPVEITDTGFVYGAADLYDDGNSSAFRWRDGVFEDLTPYSDVGAALEANNRGDVLGYHTDYRAAMWTRRGEVVDFDEFRPGGINNRGTAVGHLNGYVAILRKGEFETLDIVGSGRAISDNGFIAGSWTGSGGDTRAFVWRKGEMTDIGHLPGGTHTVARAVNVHGTVVGYSRVDGVLHAFVWRDGIMTDLTPSTEGLAYDINDRGTIAGTADRQAVIWAQSSATPPSGSGAASELLDELADTVDELNLAWRLETRLLAKLSAADRALARGREDAAVRRLQSFIRLVERREGRGLTSTDVAELVERAEEVIEAIDCMP